MQKIISIFILFLALSSCHRASITNDFIMDKAVWSKFQNLSFSQNNFTPNKAYSVRLQLDLSPDYEEKTFDFQLLIESEGGESWNQIFSLPVKNDSDAFLVKADAQNFEYSFELIPKKYFNERGIYSFELVNLNPKIKTKGVKKLSLIFNR